jgi:dynein heavy chain 1
MDSLNQIHFLYQYSLKFFLDIFSSVLYSNPKLGSVTDYGARLAIITQDLFGVSKTRLLDHKQNCVLVQMYSSDIFSHAIK